jgi:hypothetical protein
MCSSCQATKWLDRLGWFGVLGLALVLNAPRASATNANKACGLLTAVELEGAIGAKVQALEGGATGTGSRGDVDLCSAETATGRVLLRVAAKRGGAPGAEAKGVEVAKQMGFQVDVKTFGPVTCSTMIPPKNLEQHGFNTTCSVVKGAAVAAIEVTTKSRKDMVPIGKLRPLAEKMASRF